MLALSDVFNVYETYRFMLLLASFILRGTVQIIIVADTIVCHVLPLLMNLIPHVFNIFANKIITIENCTSALYDD